MITTVQKSGFELAPTVEAEVKELCLDIHTMLKRAAICTLAEGNRRFNNWVFDVRDGVVVAITNLASKAPPPRPTAPDAPRSVKRLHMTGKLVPAPKQRIAMHGEVLKDNEFTMYETCEHCGGNPDGCLVCDNGEVLVVRTLKKV